MTMYEFVKYITPLLLLLVGPFLGVVLVILNNRD